MELVKKDRFYEWMCGMLSLYKKHYNCLNPKGRKYFVNKKTFNSTKYKVNLGAAVSATYAGLFLCGCSSDKLPINVSYSH